MPKILFFRKFRKEARIWLYDEAANRALLPNQTDLIRPTFKAESTYNKWRECCKQARECCVNNWQQALDKEQAGLRARFNETNGLELQDEPVSDKCHPTWDGLSCWPASPAGKVAKHYCPDHVYFLEFVPICKGQVTKQCFENGSWFIKNGHEWSDYSRCDVLPVSIGREGEPLQPSRDLLILFGLWKPLCGWAALSTNPELILN